MSVSEKKFRSVLGQVPTAVAVVAGRDRADEPMGFSCGSFFSVSLDPQLIGFCVARTSTSWPRFTGESLCVNILTEDQHSLGDRFADRRADRFAGVAWQSGPSGQPQLAQAVAWLDCTTVDVHPAGDHFVVIASVAQLTLNAALPKRLVFHRGGYATVGEADPPAGAQPDRTVRAD